MTDSVERGTLTHARNSAGFQSPGAARRRRLSLWATALVGLSSIVVLPGLTGSAKAAPPISDPPATGQIISFPQRDYVNATGYNAPFVDVEVLRTDGGGNLVRVGFAKDVVPTAGGTVDVNHPGGACWGPTNPGDVTSAVTPNIIAGDVIRLTSLDNNHQPVAIDQTTTSNVVITQFVSQIGPSSVEMRGTALQADGVTPIPTAQVEARLVSGAKDRFDLNNKRDLRAPGAVGSTLTIDGTGNWIATFTGLTAPDVARALAAENRIIWLGRTINEMTIYEVGAVVAPGPSAGCTAPLAAAVAAPDRTSIEFLATQVGQSSVAERIRITNVGVGAFSDLNVSSVTVTGVDSGNFAVGPNGCVGTVVPVGGHCDVFVSFVPATTGVKSGVVQVQSNAGNSLIAITATGFAVDAGSQIPAGLALPSQLGFGTRAVGNTSPESLITIKNIGNANMVIAGTDITGVNPADFTITNNGCANQTLPPNGTCQVSLSLSPTAEGDRSATLTVHSNAPDVFVALTGAGLVTTNVFDPPPAGVFIGSFVARDFVSTQGWNPDELITVQVIRHGVVVGTGTATAGPDGIAEVNHPGGGCWEGTTPNIRAGDVIRATRADGTAYQTTSADVKVTQRATETAPGSGIVVMKGYARSLVNGGPLPAGQIDIRIVASTGDPFTINGRRTIRTGNGDGVFAFDPVGGANPDGINWTATFDLNASPDVPHDVNLAQTEDNRVLWLGRDPLALFETTFWEDNPGIVIDGPSAPCTAPAAAPSPGILITPNSHTFPQLTTSQSAERTYTIRNIGNAPLVVSSLTFGGNDPADFSLGSGGLPGPIAPDATATVNVKFTPKAVGVRDAVVQVNDNAVGSPHTAAATGTGVASSVASALATPAGLTFPDTQIGVASASKVVTVMNEGGSPLTFNPNPTITGANAGDFAVDQTVVGRCSTTTSLSFGQTCTVTVRLTPTAVNGRTATLNIASNDPLSPTLVALSGTSSTLADGTFDPPRPPHQLNVFPVRDYVNGFGFKANEFVRFDVYRNNVLIGSSLPASPRDSDPTDNIFDGLVEVNHVGGVCWSGSTPDLLPSDVVRAVTLDGNANVLVQDQLHIQNVQVSMPATKTAAGTVVMTGTAIDVFTGLPLPASAVEARIVTNGALFEANGRRTLRTPLEGSITMIGAAWTATFTGLSPADVATATGGMSAAIWLGRVPLTLAELTHSEFGEIPGPDPTCAATAPFAQAVPTLAPTSLNAGFSGVGIAGAAVTATFTNPGPGAVTPTVGAVTGLNAADFAVTATTCIAPVQAGGSCTVTLRFTAGALGTRLASLPITHNGANGISYLPLAGTGVSAPTANSVAPASVGHGAAITITGSNLTSTTGVTIGGVNALFAVLNDTTVTAVVPAATAAGANVAVTVSNPAGSATNSTLTVLPDPPTITLVSPATGIVNASVIITGTNLTGATVAFNGVAATVLAGSTNTRINTRVPVGATTGNITVTTVSGVASAPFTVIPGPTLTSFAPTSARRGTTITLNGANFTATTTVTFTTANGATVSAPLTSVAATQITVVVPATAVQGPVRVANTAGSSSLEFVVQLAPTVTSFAPAQGAVGSTVTITGNNFRTVNKVQFAGKNATSITVISPTQLTAVVPAGATTGTIQLGNSWGTGTSAGNFTVIPAPTIASFTPAAGTRGATIVTVTGTGLNFVTSASLVQGANVVPVVVSSLTATQLRFTIPAAMNVGLYNIRVTSLGGTANSAGALTVN